MKRSAINLCRLITATIILVASACSGSYNGTRLGAGMIAPVLTVDPDVAADQAADIVISPVPSVDELSLTISTDGYSHTWERFDEYDPAEPLLPGNYTVRAFYGTELDEGFECPAFAGEAAAEVTDGATATPEIVCTLINTMLRVEFAPSFTEYFSDAAVTFRSAGGGFVTYRPGETRQAYLRAGDIDISISLTLPDGQTADFIATTIRGAAAGRCYTATMSMDQTDGVPTVILSFDERISTDDLRIALTPDFLAATPPTAECTGFINGTPLHIDEGLLPDQPLTVKASGIAGGRLELTVNSPTLLQAGWQRETDLLSAPETLLSLMRSMGLKLNINGGIAEVDFTDVLPNLREENGDDRTSFSMRAISRAGKVSEPAILTIDLGTVDIELIAVTPVTVGIDEASLTVRCPNSEATDNLAVQIQQSDGSWSDVNLTAVEPLEIEGDYALRFRVPEGTDNIRIRLLYCGSVKAETTIGRRPPHFAILADAFALRAVIRITDADPELLPVITRLCEIYAGSDRMLQLDRDEQEGIITVTGLDAATSYTLRGTVMQQPTDDQFTEPVQITTEAAAELPNGDFEEITKGIEYDRMPSGGRYSPDIVEIFNRQNFTDFNTQEPKGWANVNTKTFCTAATRHNTWYMAPSAQTTTDVYSGAYAVRIDDVAWDTDGPAIPDYVQPAPPYVDYSRNIPQIAHKAVGKLFLGSYSFSADGLAETYTEGIPFNSRPTALNGFYKYLPASPAPARGTAIIEVIGIVDGAETVIASGKTSLGTATSYTAFSIPLTYSRFGVKATRIKVMLAASANIGDIGYETANTVTVDDPATATSRGASLWLDALSLSY